LCCAALSAAGAYPLTKRLRDDLAKWKKVQQQTGIKID